MGRLESLTSFALGRGPYEEEVIQTAEGDGRPQSQHYSENGRPRNAETRRLEREHVRAANEVMQVTGIVEDAISAKIKATETLVRKNRETLTGLRLMEAGRAVLVAGVWGVVGLRRRILLYQSYSDVGISEIIRREKAVFTIDHLFFNGMPAVLAYHISDWVAFFAETVLEAIFDEDEEITHVQRKTKKVLQGLLDAAFSYITLHLRLFAILQQLNLLPASRLLPGLESFVPFSNTSPISRPQSSLLSIASIPQCGLCLFKSAAPMLIILVHARVRFMVSRIIYRPIYKALPRPTGDSMFSGLTIAAPSLEYDAPDQDVSLADSGLQSREDASTLRALEGLPVVEQIETVSRLSEVGRDVSDDEDNEVAQATLISFDVEATDGVEPSVGTWSAELRSANDSKPLDAAKYMVTGLTMLPPIMAAEGVREIVAGILVIPLEAIMVRMIGRAFREGARLGVDDMWTVVPALNTLSFRNLLPAFGLQMAVTGVIWAGFTMTTHLWVADKFEDAKSKSE